MYKYSDYFKTYGRIMQFNKNKTEPFHRWYPFVEGYSKEFIESIIKEMNKSSLVCLEPFSGSGTTALELQNSNIKCYSFEVNPLMFLIAKVKLEKNYDVEAVDQWFKYICNIRNGVQVETLNSEFITLYQGEGKEKWNYNNDVAIAIEKLRQSIITIDDEIYKDLFMVALAAILLDVSNLYRNGKCLSYKKGWKKRVISQEEVFEKFDSKVILELKNDIEKYPRKSSVDNKECLYKADSRIGIDNQVEDNSIDLVITSPPYLNSRDYTDTYMLELKTLYFTPNYASVRKLREETLRSHVQIKWDDDTNIDNIILANTLVKLEDASLNEKMWNISIIDMIRLYFVDMKDIFHVLYKKMKINGRVYFNISNSAYFNVLIPTLDICASIAESEGFTVIEIRKARYLKTSPQQQEQIGKLLEGVIILERQR